MVEPLLICLIMTIVVILNIDISSIMQTTAK